MTKIAQYMSTDGYAVRIVLEVEDRHPHYVQMSEAVEVTFVPLNGSIEALKAARLERLQNEIEKLRRAQAQ